MSATAVMRALCGVLASAALMLGSLQQVGAQVPTEFVGVDGLHFVVGNERFYFVGTNNYYAHQFVSAQALADGLIVFTCFNFSTLGKWSREKQENATLLFIFFKKLKEKMMYFCTLDTEYVLQALSPSGQQRVLEVLDEMRDSGQTVLRTWAYSEKFGSDALQPGPYQINDRVAEALDWVIYQVRQSKPRQCLCSRRTITEGLGDEYLSTASMLSWIL